MSQDIPDTMSRDIPDRISSGVTTGSEGAGVSKARLVITAVTLEKRPVAEVAATYGVSRSWIYELLARYRDEGESAFEPRSKAPKTSPGAQHHPRPWSSCCGCAKRSTRQDTTPAPTPSAGTWSIATGPRCRGARIHRILTRHGAAPATPCMCPHTWRSPPPSSPAPSAKPQVNTASRHPGIHADRQRDGLHGPPGQPRTPRRPQRLRAATA